MLTLSTGSLYKYGLNRIFEFAKELEYEAIELVINPDAFDTYDKNYVESLINKYQIPIVGIATPVVTSKAKIVHNTIKLAEKLNVPNVIVRPPFFTDFRFTSWFKKELPKLQNKMKINIAVTNVPAGKTFLLPKFALGNINELKRYSHVCLDTSHLVTRKIDLMRVYRLLKNKLTFVHLSNWHKDNEHWLPAEGILPLESFLTKIAKDGYQGPISMKLGVDIAGGDNVKEVKKRLKDCKDFYDEYYTKSFKGKKK